jgi:hypothetical protein
VPVPVLPLVYTVNSAIDHQLLVLAAVRTTRMYWAVCVGNVTVSGEDVPVPVATLVKVLPSLETSTL